MLCFVVHKCAHFAISRNCTMCTRRKHKCRMWSRTLKCTNRAFHACQRTPTILHNCAKSAHFAPSQYTPISQNTPPLFSCDLPPLVYELTVTVSHLRKVNSEVTPTVRPGGNPEKQYDFCISDHSPEKVQKWSFFGYQNKHIFVDFGTFPVHPKTSLFGFQGP